jgi:hypothetical protein
MVEFKLNSTPVQGLKDPQREKALIQERKSIRAFNLTIMGH